VEMIDQERRRLLTGTAGGLNPAGDRASGCPGAAAGRECGPARSGGSLSDFYPDRSAAGQCPQASFPRRQSAARDHGSVSRARVVLLNFWANLVRALCREGDAIDRSAGRPNLGGADFHGSWPCRSTKAGSRPVRHFFQQARDQASRTFIWTRPNALPLAPQGASICRPPLIIDRAGAIVGLMVGPAIWDSPEALALLHYFIEKRRPRSAALWPDQRPRT